MNLQFILNDYLLAWNILFQASISEVIHKQKLKLWNTYQKQYNALMKDNIEILKEGKDFIPDDDYIYNLVFDSDNFNVFKKESEKHRIYLMKTWDKYRKKTTANLKELLRYPIDYNFDVYVIHPLLDTTSFIPKANNRAFVWGRHNDTESDLKTLIDMIYFVLSNELSDFDKENKDIVNAIIELAIKNELYTKLSGKSKYREGSEKLRGIKRQIYPYWLMYLGANKEEMLNYMMRDNLAFDLDKYAVEKELKKIDLLDFMRFCIRSKKHILTKNQFI